MLEFIVVNVLEQVFIYLFIMFLLGRKQYVLSNKNRIIAGVLIVFVNAVIVHTLRYAPGVPFLLRQYRILVQIILFVLIYMWALKLNWVQSLVGYLTVSVTIALTDGFSIAFYEFTDATFSETKLQMNSNILPWIILLKLIHAAILFVIAKFGITLKIPEDIKVGKKNITLISSLSLLLFLVFGFIRETIVNAPKIQAAYIISIVIAGGLLSIFIFQHIQKLYDGEIKAREIAKNRKKIMNIEICNEIINKNK